VSENPHKTDQSKSRTDDAGEAELQAIHDKETEQGYRGVVADPTPNDHYTLAGVVAEKPTPETDEKQADAAVAKARELGRRMEPTGRDKA
jgi:hypothetical protein